MSNRSAAARPATRERRAVEDREQVDQQPDHPHRQACRSRRSTARLFSVGGHPPILSMGAWTHDHSPDLTPAGRLAGPRRRVVRGGTGRAGPGRRPPTLARGPGRALRDPSAEPGRGPAGPARERRALLAVRPRPAVHGRGPRGGARGDRGLRRRRRHGHARAGSAGSTCRSGRSTSGGCSGTPAGCSSRSATARPATRRTAAVATCWTPPRAPGSAATTPTWSSTSTSPTTRRAATTRGGPVPWPSPATPSPSRWKQARGSEPAVGDLLS